MAPVPADREEWAAVYTAFAILRKETQRVFSRWGITTPQATVLALLAEAKTPLTVSRLAQLMMHEVPSISSIIDRMSDAGMVERVKDNSDRRVTRIRLTNKGRKLHDSVRVAAVQVSEELFGVLSNEERAELKELLQRFRRRNMQRLR
ncbi:MAG: MarR family transcriptional regulator [Dehalococcoidia bacterium]|nr:MarR family transcriptional regulator [Dehalococcoidia bacterium]